MLKPFVFLTLASTLLAEPAKMEAAGSIEPLTHQFAGYLSGEVRTLVTERLALEKCIEGLPKSARAAWALSSRAALSLLIHSS